MRGGGGGLLQVVGFCIEVKIDCSKLPIFIAEWCSRF